MEIGPFTIADVGDIKALFEAKSVAFEIVIDREAEEQILANFNDNATMAPREMAGRLDLKIVYFEFADADYDKVKDGLEKFGILALSDGSYELGEDA